MKEFASGIRAQEIVQYDADGNIVVPVASGGTVQAVNGDGDPVDFSGEAVGAHIHKTAADLATKYTWTKPEGATGLLAQNTGTAAIRYTLDGTDPTSTLGFQLRASTDPVIIPCPGAAIEFIREADGAALDAQAVK